jgi:hypothetical protein
MQILEDILHKERQASTLLKKEFIFPAARYIFDVNSPNSHRVALNDFIIGKFEETGRKRVDAWIKKICKKYCSQASLSQYLNSLDETVSFVEQQTKKTADRSSKTRFMNVFITGLTDSCASQNMQVFSTTKKFIELYLYSQGKLYAYYISALKDVTVTMSSDNNHVQQFLHPALSKQRISLLQQLRIIDAMQLQYPNLPPAEKADKIAEIISFLIGEPDKNFILRQLRITPEKKYSLPISQNAC